MLAFLLRREDVKPDDSREQQRLLYSWAARNAASTSHEE